MSKIINIKLSCHLYNDSSNIIGFSITLAFQWNCTWLQYRKTQENINCILGNPRKNIMGFKEMWFSNSGNVCRLFFLLIFVGKKLCKGCWYSTSRGLIDNWWLGFLAANNVSRQAFSCESCLGVLPIQFYIFIHALSISMLLCSKWGF